MEQPTTLMAIVTTNQNAIKGGGVPVFMASDRDSMQRISNTLQKTLDAAAHEVEPDTMIIVAH